MRVALELAKASTPNVRAQSMSNGIVLYRGPSQLDQKNIVCILTGLHRPSLNTKTGWEFVQTWIMADNGKTPMSNLWDGTDESVCGECIHRPYKDEEGKLRAGSCYVNVSKAVNAVFGAFSRGSYPEYDHRSHAYLLKRRVLRAGSYGDPVAVPIGIWSGLLKVVSGWTGYTHQWRLPFAWPYRRFLMASCDSPEDVEEAQSLGWRTFRVKLPEEERLTSEIVCPASAESGKKKTCSVCKACRGTGSVKRERSTKKSVVINAHGETHKVARFRALREQM